MESSYDAFGSAAGVTGPTTVPTAWMLETPPPSPAAREARVRDEIHRLIGIVRECETPGAEHVVAPDDLAEIKRHLVRLLRED